MIPFEPSSSSSFALTRNEEISFWPEAMKLQNRIYTTEKLPQKIISFCFMFFFFLLSRSSFVIIYISFNKRHLKLGV